MKIIRIALAGALIACAPAWAQAAAAPPMSRIPAGRPSPGPDDKAQAAMLQEWIPRIASWSGEHQTVFLQSETTLIAINAGAAQALDFVERRRIKEGAAWALDWAKARRLQLASLKAAADGLQAEPPPPPPVMTGDPGVVRVTDGLKLLGRETSKQLRASIDLGEEMVSLTEKAAAGDDQAARDLLLKRFDVAIVIMTGENTLIRTSNAMLTPGDPQIDIAEASVSTNLGMMALNLEQKRLASGEPANPQAAAEIRRYAAAALASAQQAPLDASGAKANLRSTEAFQGTAFAERVQRALDTYAESGEVEAALAGILSKVADRLEHGERADSAGVRGELGGIGQLVQRRVALDQSRKQIMANPSQ
jgi:hypothetical protein